MYSKLYFFFTRAQKAKKGQFDSKKKTQQKHIASGQAETKAKVKDRGCKKSESTYNILFNARKTAYAFRKKPATKGVSTNNWIQDYGSI